jgi:hypothetical protein
MSTCGCTDTVGEWKGNWDPFVRLCYQFGMLLGVDEFGQEQGYHLSKHRLSQRLFVGYGLVWGGQVHVDLDGDGKAILTIEPFFALDELGRELWSKEPCRIDLDQWAEENGVGDDAPVYVTVGYRSCCVAPVPAVAAPCDDAASPTMPSRAIEAVECALELEAPPAPIDLGPGTDAAGNDQAARFAILVALIREDAPRPLVLAAFTRGVTEGGHEWNPISGATPPTLPARGTGEMRVVSARVDGDQLAVEFSLAPVFAPVAAFHVERARLISPVPPDRERVRPPIDDGGRRPPPPLPTSGGGIGQLDELVDPDGGVAIDSPDGKRVRLRLRETPEAGDAYRIRIEGTGANGVLALGDQGLLPLGGGADFTLYVRS